MIHTITSKMVPYFISCKNKLIRTPQNWGVKWGQHWGVSGGFVPGTDSCSPVQHSAKRINVLSQFNSRLSYVTLSHNKFISFKIAKSKYLPQFVFNQFDNFKPDRKYDQLLYMFCFTRID